MLEIIVVLTVLYGLWSSVLNAKERKGRGVWYDVSDKNIEARRDVEDLE